MVLERNYGKAFGFEWHLLDYKAQFGRMPNCHRFIERGTTERDRVITVGRWQLVISKLEGSGAAPSAVTWR